MVGFARTVLVVLIAAVSIVLFMNLAFFFPWYLSMVESGFAVSQMVATDNYLKNDNYERMMEKLTTLPIFRERQSSIKITAVHDNGGGADAIERTYTHSPEYYYGLDEDMKPYVQMGKPVLVTVSASYPLQISLFGKPLHELLQNLPDPEFFDIKTSFKMTTTTTKHYKDLPYTYVAEPGLEVDEKIFFGKWDEDDDVW
jgi:hypothetical protein